jgi:hypothetical protein
MIDKILTLDGKVTFGKYKGYTVQYVLDENPRYLVWASENVEFFKVEQGILDRARLYSEPEIPIYERYGDEG